MVDDVLRMRATVVSEQALAELRKIGREIGIVGQRGAPGIKTINTEFARLGTTVKTVGREITSAVPALGALGFGAAGVGLALGQLGRTLADASKRVVQLKYASKELGISERDLRAWQVTAQKAGVSAQSMMSGMEAFKKTTDGLRYNIGGARDELYAMGAGPIVQRMQAATTQAEKMKVAFDFKEQLQKAEPSGFKARMFFDQIGLGADKARLSYEQFTTAQAKIKPVSKEDQEKAQKFADSLIDLGEAWNHLVTTTGVQLFPGLTKTIDALTTVLEKIEAIDRAWFKFAQGPSGKGTLLGKIVPGYDYQPNLNPRSGYRPPSAPTPDVPAGDALKNFMQPRNVNPRSGYKPTAFGDGFGGGSDLSEGSRMVKDGVFAALVEFQSYVQTGGAPAGGGFTPATFGGSAGAASARAGGGAASFGGSGYTNLTPGAGGGGSGGGGGGAQPGGSGTGTSGPSGATSSTGELPGSVPKDVMQEARNMLSRGATGGQLQQFMTEKGYPRSGAWCGQFAASVVKSAGGAPPKGAAVASNWLNWGQHVDPADVKEGDVAVRKTSRYGGMVQPGQTGGHVAFAGGAVKGGKFEMVGGNQGGIRQGVNASQYEFRRGSAGPTAAGGSAEDRKVVKGSYFGSAPDWPSDPTEPAGRPTAGGFENTMPGIALPADQYGKPRGQMYEVTGPDGKTMLLPHIDSGPHRRTGRGIDITAAGAAAMGYTSKTFPTDGGFSYRRVDEQIAGRQEVSGNVNVKIESNGTAARGSATADGLWQQSTIENYKQMQPTSAPANVAEAGP
ncbi:hypothetical protein BSZ19_21950 [Bradyrhizobium japonicum]|uniref:Peptidase C51 domain-containing protein n=1 Tax=Bradyrhizobium japonicum TaxID=375 RepID=A0A1Y2JNE8_BRAJP|nr:hypothetical protein [Bradyrhizobium japonicum]OSJ31551.1 hypothetical protein BSZ19_21950 [Bradyrhizobium japonicum]